MKGDNTPAIYSAVGSRAYHTCANVPSGDTPLFFPTPRSLADPPVLGTWSTRQCLHVGRQRLIFPSTTRSIPHQASSATRARASPTHYLTLHRLHVSWYVQSDRIAQRDKGHLYSDQVAQRDKGDIYSDHVAQRDKGHLHSDRVAQETKVISIGDKCCLCQQ